LDIFVRVNSGGTKLTAGDLMFAAMKEGWDDIEERIEQTVDLLNGGRLALDKNFPLKCLLLSEGEGAEIATEKFLGENGEALLKRMDAHWDRSEQAFQELRDFMELSLRLSSDKVVRSYNALVVIFDFIYHNPQPAEIERQRLAAYYYKAQLFGWFGSQTDSVLNSLHSIVGKPRGGRFPLEEIKDYFSSSRGLATELSRSHLDENRLKSIILNIVYIDRFGASPFNVAFRGNEPHVDHIYPQYMLRSRLSKGSAEINQIGNLRLFGATDNIRKRAELPASYFVRLQAHGVPVEKHLLVPEFGRNPDRLSFDSETFDRFCAARREEIWESLRRVVDPEIMG
jgi:hypothetical protein